ncbi:MAG: formylmethanofuran dehydrogenase subunit A [Aureliella sp.]
MKTEFRNARIIDPTHKLNGQVASLWVEGKRIVDAPTGAEPADKIIDLKGGLLLAGGIDIHTHIGGGKVNVARMLLSDLAEQDRSVWPTRRTGELYNNIGYTTCFEPAMLLPTARHTHLELSDTPNIDSGAYIVLGNEDWLLRAIGQRVENATLDSLVAWAVSASRAMAVKVVNPGGISAFRFNQRSLDVDEQHTAFGVSPRDVVRRLCESVQRIGLPHPLHVHASNLGVPGNVRSTIQTLEASEGLPIHLTHAQFNCYSDQGKFSMGSGAEELAKYVNEHKNVSLDVGQVVFGQTVTISADTRAQYENRLHASPKRWTVNDVGCSAGCGAVPMRYQDEKYVHSLQWCIGLELMLLVEDPWRVFLTTDHPNGGPFTCYPHLMRLLMDKSFRQSHVERLHPDAAANTLLREIDREYTLDEIAIATRAAPAKILQMTDRGTLQSGAVADLAAYRPMPDWEATFANANYVMKSGQCVIAEGQPTCTNVACATLSANIQYDASAITGYRGELEQTLLHPLEQLQISKCELDDMIRDRTLTSYSRILQKNGARRGD